MCSNDVRTRDANSNTGGIKFVSFGTVNIHNAGVAPLSKALGACKSIVASILQCFMSLNHIQGYTCDT